MLALVRSIPDENFRDILMYLLVRPHAVFPDFAFSNFQAACRVRVGQEARERKIQRGV